MKKEFRHFLVTRFNLGFKTKYPDKKVRDEWMSSRVKAFETITLPSVSAQTDKNFTWLILFDPSVKEDYPELIQKLEALDFCEPLYLEAENFYISEFLKESIEQRTDPEIRHIITSRLDSDDAIHQDYIKDIQSHFVPGKTYIVSFTDGFGYADYIACIFRRNMVSFASLYECLDVAELQTIYCTSHTKLKNLAPVKHVSGKPMFIYYHHDDNISNNRLRMTSIFKLPLDFIGHFLCKKIPLLNKYLRYSYRIEISKDHPQLALFNTKL